MRTQEAVPVLDTVVADSSGSNTAQGSAHSDTDGTSVLRH